MSSSARKRWPLLFTVNEVENRISHRYNLVMASESSAHTISHTQTKRDKRRWLDNVHPIRLNVLNVFAYSCFRDAFLLICQHCALFVGHLMSRSAGRTAHQPVIPNGICWRLNRNNKNYHSLLSSRYRTDICLPQRLPCTSNK